MGNENKENKNVNTLNDFIEGKCLSLETIITREDRDEYILLHFIDKETGISLFDQWIKKGNLFKREEKPKNENIGGQEPYVRLYYRRIDKVVNGGEFVGGLDSQLSTLTLLCKHIQMNTGKLVKKRTKKPLTMADIAQTLNVSVRRAADIIANLKANGFVERKDNAYFVNRKFYFKGRTYHE
jgi:hypothetical protein